MPLSVNKVIKKTTFFVPPVSDIDECATGAENCSPNANCTNIPGNFTCTCIHGYSGDGILCLGECFVNRALQILQSNPSLVIISNSFVNVVLNYWQQEIFMYLRVL